MRKWYFSHSAFTIQLRANVQLGAMAFSLFHAITYLYHLIPLIEIQNDCSLSEKLQFTIEIIVGGL